MGQMRSIMSIQRRADSFRLLQLSSTPWAAAWLVAVLLPLLGAVTGQTNSSHDLLALQQLNASINNPPAAGTAPGMRSWVGTAFCAGWEGVLCSDAGRVWSLQLPGVRLSGTIPASLRNMTELRILDLSSNQLAGAWPPLGDMLNLRSLDLSNNLLGINVSQAAMQMSLDALNGSTSLQHLLLGNNPSMMGSFPAWSGLIQLRNLSLGGNRNMTGQLPAAWGAFTSLVHLDLSGTSWQPLPTVAWPGTWSSLSQLLLLNLSQPAVAPNTTDWPGGLITVPLPADWATAMSLLRSFSCAYCNWAGSAVSSSSLNAYAQLQYLDIRGNRFTAPLAWLGSFTTSTVRFLYASDMNLTLPAGMLPGWNVTSPWGSSMRALDLRGNPLAALMPVACSDLVGGLTALTQLYLNGTGVGPCSPAQFQGCLTDVLPVGARNYTTCNLDEDVQPDMLLEFKRAFPVWPATGIRGWQPAPKFPGSCQAFDATMVEYWVEPNRTNVTSGSSCQWWCASDPDCRMFRYDRGAGLCDRWSSANLTGGTPTVPWMVTNTSNWFSGFCNGATLSLPFWSGVSGTFYASPHLRRITDLNLQGWGINGTAANLGTALRGMFGLFRLNMSLNALQGDLSAAFAQAPMGVAELQHLDVSFNPGLTVANAGALPPLLRELMTFNMSGCPLNMPVPAVWFWDINPNPNNRSAPFWRLSQLRLRQSGLTGTLPASWYLPFLGMLDLSSNPSLNGTFYPPLVVNTSLPKPPSVSWLNLSFTGLSGNLSHPSVNWNSVQVLSLRGNSLVNGLLPVNLTSLQAVDLTNTSAGSGSRPLPDISSYPNLKELHLGGTLYGGAFPAGWVSAAARLMCLSLGPNPSLCGLPPDNLPCFDTTGTKVWYDCANTAVLLAPTNRTCRYFRPDSMNAPCMFSGPSVVYSANGAVLQQLWSSLGSPFQTDWPPTKYTINSSVPAPGPSARGDPCIGMWPGVTCNGSSITGVSTTGGTWMNPDIFANMRTDMPNLTQLMIQGSYLDSSGAARLIANLSSQLRSLSLDTVTSVPMNFYPGFEYMPQLQQLSISCSDFSPQMRTFPPSWVTVNASARAWPALRSLSIRGCGATGNLSWVDTAGVLPFATSLDLSRNALAGPLPAVRVQGHMGCWPSADVPGNYTQLQASTVSLSACAAAAAGAGMRFIAIGGKSSCYGGGILPPTAAGPDSSCYMPCGTSTPNTPSTYPACANNSSFAAFWLVSAVQGPPLQFLNLGYNQITGTLRDQWAPPGSPLNSLTFLGLAANQLAGTLPATWLDNSTWPSLQAAHLWGNPGLCGATPPLTGVARSCLDVTGTSLGWPCNPANMTPPTPPAACTLPSPVMGVPPTPLQGPQLVQNRTALLQLKASLGPAAAGMLQSWTNDTAPCGSVPWPNVQCDGAGRVIGVDLSNAGLGGPLPAAGFMLMDGLQYLNMSGNWFTASMPDLRTILNATRNSLVSLDLSYNPLKVAWPSGTDTIWMGYLRMLRCRQCGLTGTLAGMGGLQVMDVPGNNLTWDASSWTYSQLQYVDMSYNLAVTGLGSLGQLPTNLRVGRFRRAGITYSTLSGGSSMMSLKELDMSGNNIGWTLPGAPVSGWLGPNVSMLDLSETQLSGSMGGATWPSSLQRLSLARNPNLSGALSNPPPSVTYLDISGTGITGTLPLPAAMPNLTCLLVRDSAMLCGSVANDMPCSVSSAAGMSGTNLLKDCATNATLSGPTSCSGQPPDCDAGATQAANLIQWIGGRNASAAAALGWSGYDACSGPGWGNVGCEDGVIRSLQLADMGLAGTLGTLLDDMNTLRELNLSSNSINGSLPTALPPQLKVLDLSFNNISGPLPTAWATNTSSNLELLYLSGNPVGGQLPDSWGNITGAPQGMLLQRPSTIWTPSIPGWTPLPTSNSSNTTAGPGPPGLWRLMRFTCSSCQLAGELPNTGWLLPMLTEVDVSRNNLTGALKRIGGPRLRQLNVGANQLNSTLPANVSSWWPGLGSLVAYKNQLRGMLPAAWASWAPAGPLMLQLSGNLLTGTLPAAWGSVDPAPASNISLRNQLAALDLSSNRLNVSSIPASWANMTGLMCWSLANNTQLCGPVVSNITCPVTMMTNLGLACDGTGPVPRPCNPVPLMCRTLPDYMGGVPLPPTTIDDDIKALLDLRGLMLGSSPSPNLTTVGTPDLTDWVAGGQPCSTPSCEPCAPTAAPCNAPSPQGQTCSWPYVGCKDGRINRVVLGMALAGGTSTNPLLHLNGIPASLYNLTQLEELQLFGVELRNGTLPADLGRLPFLQALHLQSGPGVTGTLPDWNGMTSLRELRVVLGPNITGTLPAAWGGMSSLQMLDVQGFQSGATNITGPIPATWGQLQSLQWLSLQVLLRLTSQFPPAGWGALPQLSSLTLGGGLPNVTAQLPTLLTWLAGSPGLQNLQVVGIGISPPNNTFQTPQFMSLPSTFVNLTSVAFNALGLQGTLPAEWGLLPSGQQRFTQLNFGSNSLNGTVPGSWWQLIDSKAAAVDLSRNQLSGPLPGAWAQSSSSLKLDLSNNQITAGLPPEWWPLVNESVSINLSRNQLKGPFPGEWSGPATPTTASATSLNIRDNPCLCGPTPPAWLATVMSTNTSIGTPCNGTLPAVCTITYPADWLLDVPALLTLKAAASDDPTLSRLASWDLSNGPPCAVNVGGPSASGDCEMCDRSMSDTFCGGPRPSDGRTTCRWRFVECRAKRVVKLVLYAEGSFTMLPANLTSNTSMLEVLDMSKAVVQLGGIPDSYGSWPRLRIFRPPSGLAGTLPATLAALSNLTTFEVSQSPGLSGTIPPSYFTNWTRLQNFSLENTNITGSLPAPWACTQLNMYMVLNTPVTSGPPGAADQLWLLDPRAANLTRLNFIGFGGTQLSMPTWYGFKTLLRAQGLTNLTAVRVPSNGWKGPIGPLRYYFPALRMLDLSYNQMVSMPDLVAEFNGTLALLDLSFNKLRGTLPANLMSAFSPTSTEMFSLESNEFYGTLPAAWGTANRTWESFSLANNWLTGGIPDSWTSMVWGGGGFDVSNNFLSGPIPVSWANVTVRPEARPPTVRNNPCLCGEVPAQLAMWAGSPEAAGTNLTTPCAPDCIPNAPVPGNITSPDTPPLLDFLARIVQGNPYALATWNQSVPCSLREAVCTPCDTSMDPVACGQPVPQWSGYTGPPQWYCNFRGISCDPGGGWSVTGINISNTGVVLDNLPTSLPSLSELQLLSISGGGTALQNTTVDATFWSSFPKLTVLQLSGGAPYAPEMVDTLDTLQRLLLSNASVGNMDWLVNATQLVELSLVNLTMPAGSTLAASWGNVSGTIAFPMLRSLELRAVTNLQGPLPTSWLTGFPQLRSLWMSGMPALGGTVQLSDWLSMLHVPWRLANTSAPSSDSDWQLQLSGLNMTGTIPPAMFTNNRWRSISLANNQLQGALLPDWGVLTNLTNLDLSNNGFSGTLPLNWNNLRAPAGSGVTISMAGNALVTGPLPAVWAVNGSNWALRRLDATNCSLTGSLPDSFRFLSKSVPTSLLLAGNQLQQSVPESWGSRNLYGTGANGSAWDSIVLNNNPSMCGSLPSWWSLQFPTITVIPGTLLGGNCSSSRLNVTNAQAGTFIQGTQLQIQLFTPVASGGNWTVSLQQGNTSAPWVTMGNMLLVSGGAGNATWAFVVNGSFVQQPGPYWIKAEHPTVPAGGVMNSPAMLTALPGGPVVNTSRLTVDLPANMTTGMLGMTVVVRIAPRDIGGAPTTDAVAMDVVVVGGRFSAVLPGSTFITSSVPNTMETGWQLPVLGNITFRLVPAGTTPAAAMALPPASSNTSVVLAVQGVQPGTIDMQLSINATHLQRASDAIRQPVQAVIAAAANDTLPPGAMPVPVAGVNLLYVPPLRSGSGAALAAAAGNFSWFAASGQLAVGGFTANPGLRIQMTFVQLAPDLTRMMNTTQLLNGSWSSTQQAYVLGFRCPSQAAYQAFLNFTHTVAGYTTLQATAQMVFNASFATAAASMSDMTLAAMAPGVNATSVAAAGANTSSLLQVPPSTAVVGSRVYVLVTLRTAAGRPVMQAGGVQVNVTGTVSGQLALPALSRTTDGFWATWFVPTGAETLTALAAVGSQLVRTLQLQALGSGAGVNPFYLNYAASAAAATLVSQNMASTSPVASGSALLVYTNESSLLSAPILDVGGRGVSADPGVAVRLCLVPANISSRVLARYALASSNSTNSTSGTPPATRRRLLQAPAPSPAPVPAGPAPTPLLDYDSSLLSEPPAPEVLAGAVNASNATAADAGSSSVALPTGTLIGSLAFDVPQPDAGWLVQDRLPLEPGVTTVSGSFNPTTGAYVFSIYPTAVVTYAAVLMLRHPFVPTSQQLAVFTLNSIQDPAVAAAQAAAAASAAAAAASAAVAPPPAPTGPVLNPLSMPRVAFTATFPTMTAAGYGGLTRALGDYKSILAAACGLDSTDWVVAAAAGQAPLALNTTVWFPPTWTSLSSPFAGMTTFDFLVMLLNKAPAVAFTSSSYSSWAPNGVQVAGLQSALPGASLSSAIISNTTSGSGSSGSSSGSGGATSTPAATLQVVAINAADLQVVVPSGSSASSSSSGAASAPPAVDLSKLVDREPPVMTLVGPSYQEVLELSRYTDPGVTAYDNVDGNSVLPRTRIQLCNRPAGLRPWDPAGSSATLSADPTDNSTLTCGSSSLALVDTTWPTVNSTTPGGGRLYVLTYTARDTAGNTATPLRRLVAVVQRCAAPERWCQREVPTLASCSTKGVCSAGLAAFSGAAGTSSGGAAAGSPSSATTTTTAAAAAAAAYVPPVDRTPPRLRLLGSGTAAITATGAALMLDTTPFNRPWVDAGAVAFDDVDGNLTTSIQTFGVGAVDTSVPTSSAGVGYVVEYYVEDRSKNAAPIARRLVKVVCPGQEAVCSDPDSGQLTCTVGGSCGKQLSALSTAAATAAAPPAAGSSTATTGRSGATTAGPAPPSAPTPPRVTLLGPSTVEVPAGGVFDRCAATATAGSLCDQGVTADDAQDGNMDRQVMICGNRWRPLVSSARAVPVLLACGVDITRPGEYTLTYSATNSAGLTASVTRQLVVKAVCPSGEVLCEDKVTCSVGGACGVAAAASPPPGGSSPAASPGAPAPAPAPAVLTRLRRANQAPNITLITTPDLDTVVRLKRGTRYPACDAGIRPTAEAVCEAGATAFDPDGGPDMAGMNLTEQVVVCPPADCLTQGCSANTLRAHRFNVKGLQGCAYDPMAPVGTQFVVDFWVWDAGMPVLSANVNRTLILTAPCTSDSTPFFCTDSISGRSFCSGTPCGQATKYLPPSSGQLQLVLLPAPGVVYLQYGVPAPFSLRPCASLAANSSCGAVAFQQAAVSGGSVRDLTPDVQVQDMTPCDPSQAPCVACDLAALSSLGACLPGQYSFQYSVSTTDGSSSVTLTRSVVVYQVATVNFWLPVSTSYDNSTAAAAAAAVITARNGTSVADAAAAVAVSLVAAGVSVVDSDVVIHGADIQTETFWNYTVIVNATVYFYTPEGVHYADVAAANSALGISGGSRRRQLLVSGAMPSPSDEVCLWQPDQGAACAGSASSAVGGVAGSTQAPAVQQQAMGLEAQAAGLQPRDGGVFGGVVSQLWLNAVQAVHAGQVTMITAMQHLLHSASHHQQQGVHSAMVLPWQLARTDETIQDSSSLSLITPGPHRRRLMQAAGNNAVAAAAALGGAGASGVSSQSQGQPVDEIAGYLASLASAVSTLEAATANLNTSTLALGPLLNSTFGAAGAQAEVAGAAAATAAFQALLGDWSTFTHNVTALATNASANADALTAAAANMEAAGRDTQTLMQEAAAWGSRLTQQYVAETAMIADVVAGGMMYVAVPCARATSGAVDAHFQVSRANSSSTRRRSLLQARGGGAAAVNQGSVIDSEYEEWQGYSLSGGDTAAGEGGAWGREAAAVDTPDRARYLGAERNRLVAGLFLHTTRKPTQLTCDNAGRLAQLALGCNKLSISFVTPGSNSSSGVLAYLAALLGPSGTDLNPYGVDPVYLRSSSLYQPDLVGLEEQYYNTSDGAQVPNATGVPYGYYPRSLKGYAAGFPVLLPTGVSALRASQLVTHLLDGNYLDSQRSKAMTAELLTYNPDLQLLGYMRGSFAWASHGQVEGAWSVVALPAIQPGQAGWVLSTQSLTLTVPLWLLVVAFCVGLGLKGEQLVRSYGGTRHWSKVLCSNSAWLLDAFLAALMLAAVVLITTYVAALAPAMKPQGGYTVYDAVETAPARWFMPARDSSNAAVAAAAQQLPGVAAASGTSSDVSGLTVDGLRQPGGPGRWLLPAVDGDMDALGGLLSSVAACMDAWSLYGLLQCLVLLLLLVRLLMAWSFQTRLGIITQTLVECIPQVAHLCLVIAVCMAMFSSLLSLGVGFRVGPASSYGGAWYDMFLNILAGSEVDIVSLFPDGLLQLDVQRVMVTLILYLREVLFAFILMNYFMAVVGAVFMRCKRQAHAHMLASKRAGGPGGSMGAELAAYFWPELLPATKAAARGLVKRRGCVRSGGRAVLPVGGSDAAVEHATAMQLLSCMALQRWLAAQSGAVVQKPQAAAADTLLAMQLVVWGTPKGRQKQQARRGAKPGVLQVDREALQQLLLKRLAEQRAAAATGRGAAAVIVEELQHLGRRQRTLLGNPGRRTSVTLDESGQAEAPAADAAMVPALEDSRPSRLPKDWSDAAAEAVAGGADPGVVAGAMLVGLALLRALGVPASEASVAAAHEALVRQGVIAETQLSSTAKAAGLAAELQAALSAPEKDQLTLQAHVFAALWNAIASMERWSVASCKWAARVIKEENSWLEANEALLRRHQLAAAAEGHVGCDMAGPGSSSGRVPDMPDVAALLDGPGGLAHSHLSPVLQRTITEDPELIQRRISSMGSWAGRRSTASTGGVKPRSRGSTQSLDVASAAAAVAASASQTGGRGSAGRRHSMEAAAGTRRPAALALEQVDGNAAAAAEPALPTPTRHIASAAGPGSHSTKSHLATSRRSLDSSAHTWSQKGNLGEDGQQVVATPGAVLMEGEPSWDNSSPGSLSQAAGRSSLRSSSGGVLLASAAGATSQGAGRSSVILEDAAGDSASPSRLMPVPPQSPSSAGAPRRDRPRQSAVSRLGVAAPASLSETVEESP